MVDEWRRNSSWEAKDGGPHQGVQGERSWNCGSLELKGGVSEAGPMGGGTGGGAAAAGGEAQEKGVASAAAGQGCREEACRRKTSGRSSSWSLRGHGRGVGGRGGKERKQTAKIS